MATDTKQLQQRGTPGIITTVVLSLVYLALAAMAVHSHWGTHFWAWILTLAESWGISERWLFMILTVLVLEVTFIGYCTILHIVHVRGMFPGWRVYGQAGKYPDSALVKEALWDHVINSLVVRWFILYFGYDLFKLCGMKADVASLPSPWKLAGELLVCILIDDTWFYWSHRLLHTPWLYQKVHKQHHRFRATIGIASEFAHPVEAIISNLASTIIGPLLLSSHMAVVVLYIFLKLHQTIEAHSGYYVPYPFSVWSLFDIMENGRHEFHHSHNVGNFGGMFYFWDHLMGTDAAFCQWREKNGVGPFGKDEIIISDGVAMGGKTD